MKRWMLIALLFVVFVSGIGYGIVSAHAIWTIGFTVGGMRENAQLVLDTQEFREAVESRKPFNRGDYTFIPCREAKTVKVRRRVPSGIGGPEK